MWLHGLGGWSPRVPPEPHLGLVRAVAVGVHRRLPPGVPLDELLAEGVVGLLDACDRFDPLRGATFETFARRRIHGAILDSLRTWDWIPSSTRRRIREVEATTAILRRRLGREPTPGEVAAHSGLSEAVVVAARRADTRAVLSLDEVVADEAGGTLVERIPDSADPPDAAMESDQLRALVRRAIDRLPERERLAVQLVHLAGISLKRAGEELGVTESRVCQLCGQAIRRLRRTLSAHRPRRSAEGGSSGPL